MRYAIHDGPEESVHVPVYSPRCIGCSRNLARFELRKQHAICLSCTIDPPASLDFETMLFAARFRTVGAR